MANLAPVPEELTDEQVLMCPDIMSTGFGGAESGSIRIGDTVAVFAQGPIGLCATVGRALLGRARASSRWTACPSGWRCRRRSGRMCAWTSTTATPSGRIIELTLGRGVDVAIEALGTQQTFESCLRVLQPGRGAVVSLGVYAGKLSCRWTPSRRAWATTPW